MNSLERLGQNLAKKGYGDRLCFDEPLSRHTSFSIGGPADLLMIARAPDELCEWLQMARAEGVPSLVIGRGTNILVADAGVRGIVIVNACRDFTIDNNGLLMAQSGALLREMAHCSIESGWQGLEWAVGIPGTLGGGIVGNAGAYGGYMVDVVRWVNVLQPNGALERLGVEDLGFGYRTSALKRQARQGSRPIVLEAGLQLAPGDVEVLKARVAEIATRRKAHSPEGCCAGSVFRRTQQYPAGFLIEQAGLKGYRVGGAQVSSKHANFLMNTGGATAADMRALIEKVQSQVWAVFAQRLEPEIEFVGEWS